MPSDGQPQREDDPRTPRRSLLLAAGVAVLALAIARIAIVETVHVTSDSMEPSLQVGDRLVVLKTTSIDVGDVIVFDGTHLFGERAPGTAQADAGGALEALARLLGADSNAYVKRVVGVPGDRVVCCSDDGRLVRNGEVLDEPYAVGRTDGVTFDVTVPADRFWVLGDNRAVSADSRAALGRPGGGMLRADDVVGEVVLRYWPPGRTGVTATGVRHTGSPDGPAAHARRAMGDTSQDEDHRGVAPRPTLDLDEPQEPVP